jgi:hypothetical protein
LLSFAVPAGPGYLGNLEVAGSLVLGGGLGEVFGQGFVDHYFDTRVGQLADDVVDALGSEPRCCRLAGNCLGGNQPGPVSALAESRHDFTYGVR